MRLRCLTLCLFTCVFLLSLGTAHASIKDREATLHQYFDEPASKYNIPKELVMAIARQESGMHPLCINIQGRDIYPKSKEEAIAIAKRCLERGLSFDVGLMQVNSYWIRRHKFNLDLLFDIENNITVGCWILAQEIRRHGFGWKAVAYYHTPVHKNPARGNDYAKRIRKHLVNIIVGK